MHNTNIRSSAVSLEIREKKYIIKHVNSVLDTKQFAKKAHALSSSTVNVVCAKVTTTSTTTSTQNMWNGMNNVTDTRRKQSIDSFDRLFPEKNRHDTSTDEEEEEEEEEEEDIKDNVDHYSELDIMNDSCSSQQPSASEEEEEEEESEEELTPRERERRQQEYYNSQHNLFEFHFEFGSKRPPTTTFVPSEDEIEEQVSDLPEDEDSDLSIDERDWDSQKRDVMEDTKYFPSATNEALETFENITENIYIGNATGRSMAEESMPCECKYDSELDNPSEACGDDNICINRMMFMECIVQDCPCGRLCQNRRFQLGQYAPVDVIKTELKGFGLRALADLPSNCFIMEYIGEVIPQTEFISRTREYDAEGFKHYYFMTLKNEEIIDATKRGCLARFMNHSCNPNCVTQKWVIGKKMRIGIFTSRPIKAGEELTFDYKFERYGAVAQKCYCGESNCKGFIGASDEKVVDEDVLTDSNINASSSNSSSDDDDYDNEESDDEELDVVTIRRHQPLQDPDKVRSFVKRMLNSVGKPRLVNKLLMRLKMTNVDNSHGREILKMIVRLHGLKMLKFWLGEWKNNETIVLKALQVLEKLPLANRNGLEDCKLFDVVQKFVDHENEDISRLAQDLLDEWSDLKCVYRIPKRAQVELIRPSTEDEDEDDISIYDEETEGEPTESVEPITTQDTTTVASTTPKKNPGHNKKKRKRIRYESSREFFDPDKDFFEYISMNATAEEILSKMQYPPRSSLIPTAPKAMLDTTSTATNTPIVHHSKHYKHKNHITPTINTTPGYFPYNTVNNDNISSFNSLTSTPTSSLNNRQFVPTSTPTTAANINVNNTSTISTPISTLTINTNNNNMNTQPDYQQPQQHQLPPHHHYYTEYYQDPSSMYDYSQFYYASAAAAAEGMTVEEYYYAYQVQQQQQQQQQVLIQQQQQHHHPVAEPAQHNGTALPLNWQMATAEDGSVYYYNVSTQQTQWEVPVGDIPPPPPPPLPPPPPPPLSTIEGAPDSSQLEDLVEQAVNTTEDKKKKRLQEDLMSSSSMNNSPTTSRDENHHLLTPASGSVDATTEDHGAYLNDIDLKREVGKVVTKYLSAKQQALWKGDKHLFKDLARKVTHHIVDREIQSGRKIKAVDTALRIKIEKFIDAYGTDYVSKFMQRNPSISSSSSPSTK